MKNLVWAGIILVVIGIALIVIGLQERGLANMSSKVPEEISLKNLIARGLDSNPNIILTDYTACGDIVFLTKNGRWESVCVPVVPPEMIPPGLAAFRPPQVQAVIRSTKARSQQDVENICAQPKVRALVTNRIDSLGSLELGELKKVYPGTDFSRCLIIHEGREPAGSTKLMLLIGGGSVAALAGLSCLGIAVFLWSQQGKATPSRRKRRARDEEDEEEEEDEAPRKRKRPARAVEEDEDEAPPRRKRPARDVEEEEDEPAPRKRRRPARDDDAD